MPVKLRVDGQDVAIATGARMWVVTEETVLALNPSKIEALDAKGVVLRAHTFERDDDDDHDERAAAAEKRSELVLLARLIAEAHDAGARRHAEAYALAFTENTRLVQVLSARLGGLESAWQKAMQQTAQANADAILANAQQSDDPAGNAIAGMMAQMALASAAQAKPKPNGKPATKGEK